MGAVHPYAWRNGELVPGAEVCLSPFQTGLLSGWGLFSTLRIYEGIPFALEAHWSRLCADGARLHVAVGDLWEELQQGFEAVIAGNGAREAVARVYCIRNHGGLLDMPGPRATDLLIFTRALRSWGASAKLGVQPHGRHAQAPLAGTKTLTWAHNLVLLEEANEAGYDDVLLLNERGEVAECTAANIFIERAGALLTPPLASGALPGVSRNLLLEAGPRHGLRVEEATLWPQDLFAASEVLITSSTREVQPVAEIAGHRYVPGPLAPRVAELFRQEVRAYLVRRRRPEQPETAPLVRGG